MPNAYKVLPLGLIAAFTLGAASLIPEKRVAELDPQNAPTLGALYAAPVERVETHVLRNGETLTTVLAQARITGQEMADLLLGVREHLNPRRMAPGSEVTVRRWVRSDEPRTIEVRVNQDSTIRLVRSDIRGWDGQVIITPTRIDTVYAGGVIDNGRTSLYESVMLDEQSRLPVRERAELVYALAAIYEYKLDFTREIQPGDAYRVVYEREARPDGTARSKKILTAEIVTKGHPFTAIWFEGAQGKGYYDADARPLADGFSRYPVAFPRITSNYNPNRYHPILGQYRAHSGTDFGAPTGTPVMATANGTVTFAGTQGGYGRMIEIRHFNGYTTRYAHLSRFAEGVRAGARVSQKQVVGYVGATGLATAPHLHYELRISGRAVDARTAKLPDSPPLTGALRSSFLALAKDRSTLLDRIPHGGHYAEAHGRMSAERTGEE
jgi:murein DD-endopeptidase MepM/ murein hydrolase activator NlpD